ncbi:hypothetical protein OAG68_01050 [bacterium]|nr:hypothetical protein [bacterium]
MKTLQYHSATGLVLLASLFIATACPAQETASNEFGFNSEAIDWVIPGEFKDALDRSRQQERILLVRGLGFGLDELGATCATKGCW